MGTTSFGKRIAVVVASVVLTIAGVVVAGGLTGPATAATVNRRPICNSIYFNLPNAGGSVVIPVLDFAADPDLTPVRVVSVSGQSGIGTVTITGSGLLFTLTANFPVTVWLNWTISDGALTATCSASATNEQPPENG